MVGDFIDHIVLYAYVGLQSGGIQYVGLQDEDEGMNVIEVRLEGLDSWLAAASGCWC